MQLILKDVATCLIVPYSSAIDVLQFITLACGLEKIMNKYFVLGIATAVALILAHFVSGLVGVVVLAVAVFAYDYFAPNANTESIAEPQTASIPQTSNVASNDISTASALTGVTQTATEVLSDCESSLGNIKSTHNDSVDTLCSSFLG